MLAWLVAWLVAQSSSDTGSTIGKNIQDLLQGLAAPVYLGLVGIMALAFLAGRKIGALAVYLCIAIGVGILILNPNGFANIVKSIGDAISQNV